MRLLFLVVCNALVMGSVAQAPQVLWSEDFTNGGGGFSLSPDWVWNGSAPITETGCAGQNGVAKPSGTIAQLPQGHDVAPGWMFHPLPFDHLKHYRLAYQAYLDEETSADLPVLYMAFTWWDIAQTTGFAGSTQYTMLQFCSAEQYTEYASVNTSFAPSGAPGTQFGLLLYVNSPVPINYHLFTLRVETMPNQAMFSGNMFLEGPYDPTTQLMVDDLRQQGFIPLTEPYSAMSYPQLSGGGGETVTPSVLNASYSGAHVVDWVRLELRSSNDPSQLVATRQALLLQNGTVIGSDGGPPFFGILPGTYYVAVRHRNHLGSMTATQTTVPSPVYGGVWNYYFGHPDMSTWGTASRKIIGSTAVLWAGNALPDDRLKYVGTNNDRDAILQAIGGVTPTNTISGYHHPDVTMDGIVKYTGSNNDRDPILVNIGGTVPTAVRIEQVP